MSSKKLTKVGIIGASGFVGSELVGILLKHSHTEIVGISSQSNQGKAFSELYPTFRGQFEETFESNDTVIEKAEVVFLCLPHGQSESLVKKSRELGKKVIDIGADFRLKNLTTYEDWYDVKVNDPALHEEAVYGLPEIDREAIAHSSLIANPGCYPTSILLGLYPAIVNGIGDTSKLIIDSKSGVTGSGKTPSELLHFPNRNEGFQAYKVTSHRHTPEVEEKLSLMGAEDAKIIFTPHLLPINRGILSTIYLDLVDNETTTEMVHQFYQEKYEDEPFVQVLPIDQWPDVSHVQHSNQCHISVKVDEHTNRLIIISVIDNMQKGAAGQAVQNYNIMLGFDETEGLTMAAPSF